MIAENAWWCDYCINKVPDKTGCTYSCAKEVPWYCSSVDCKYYDDEHKVPPAMRKRRFNLNKVLVETF